MDRPLFNIRVYGIFIKENRVLVTDEYRFGIEMTKFPGGGLDYGEGIIDCLKRECREELNCEIDIKNHFYTTDFFQKSAFDEKQLISIYYEISIPDFETIQIDSEKFNFNGKEEGSQTFRLLDVNKQLKEELTFPVDKVVAGMLAEKLIK